MRETAEVTRALARGMMRSTDVAAYLGVSRQRVDQLSAKDGFPAPSKIAGLRMWERDAIERWAESSWWGSRPWRTKP